MTRWERGTILVGARGLILIKEHREAAAIDNDRLLRDALCENLKKRIRDQLFHTSYVCRVLLHIELREVYRRELWSFYRLCHPLSRR